jgi:Undecaprenyl-phosphate glucose phosphotransferase
MSLAVSKRAEDEAIAQESPPARASVSIDESAASPEDPALDGRFGGLSLPPGETDRTDRRGPLRPNSLISTRSRLNSRTLRIIFRVGDAAAIAVATIGACSLSNGEAAAGPFPVAVIMIMAGLLLAWSLAAVGAYDVAPRDGLGQHLVRTGAAFGLTGAIMSVGLFAARPPPTDLAALGFWFCMSFCVLWGLHAGWWLTARRWRRIGRLTPTVVIVGATGAADQLIGGALCQRDVSVIGVFDDRIGRVPEHLRGVPVLGDVEALVSHRVMPYVDRIVITVTSKAQDRVRQLIDTLSVLPNEIVLYLDDAEEQDQNAALMRIADAPLERVSGPAEDERRALLKRVQDLVVGLLALIALAPAMLLTAIAVKLDSPGPVFFRQRRHGFNNEEILVWKFRSMRADRADATAAKQVSVGDDRVTRVGRFIRRTSLDELPQILNVLKGEMSLVGPRPHAVGMRTGATESAKLVATYAHRHRMKPGMTGWAAIKGSRGPVDTPDLVRRRVALDVEYIESQSFWLDLYIMVMTIPCLLGDTQAPR